MAYKEELSAATEAPASSPRPGHLSEEVMFDADACVEPAPSTEATPLTALLEQEARCRRREELTILAWSVHFLALMLWIPNSTTHAASMTRNLILCFVLMGGVMGTGMCVQFYRRSYRRKRSLTTALAQSQDVTQVGYLIQALRVQNTRVCNLAKRTLIVLLPTLKASDAARLGDSERAILLRLLSIPPNDLGRRDLKELFSRLAYRRELELRLAILKALEQVGGARELATVERLARGLPGPPSISKICREIQEAAQECLPYLQMRANVQRAREELLRASGAHARLNGGLLRPAGPPTDAFPEQLLRSSKPRV